MQKLLKVYLFNTLVKIITKETLLKAMLDFDSTTSLDQDVLEYMTENKMYRIYDSKEESIDFALQRIGRSLMQTDECNGCGVKLRLVKFVHLVLLGKFILEKNSIKQVFCT